MSGRSAALGCDRSAGPSAPVAQSRRPNTTKQRPSADPTGAVTAVLKADRCEVREFSAKRKPRKAEAVERFQSSRESAADRVGENETLGADEMDGREVAR